MIRRPGHTVNDDARRGPLPTAPDGLDGLDGPDGPDGLDVAAANVARWGGDVPLFGAALAAGLAAVSGSDQHVRDLATVAAWRAGVLGLRDDALRAAGAVPARAVAAVLGLPDADVAGFVEAQRTDRFFWPPWTTIERSYLLARIGGFAGLGGPWSRRPGDVLSAGDGRWLVHIGDDRWEVCADLFGHVLTKVRDNDSFEEAPETHVRLVSLPTSYHLELIRTAP